MKNFLSTKSSIAVGILWAVVSFLVIMITISVIRHEIETTPLLILSLTCALLIWVLLDTRYVIKNSNLYYRSGPFRGRIDIKKVTKIQYCSELNNPTTFKPALDFKGYILTYNAGNTIYVSPEKAINFIEELLKINPKIECLYK